METRHAQIGRDMVRIGDAAKMIGVSIETLRRWEAEGVITAGRTPGGQRRYPVDQIEALKREMASRGGAS